MSDETRDVEDVEDIPYYDLAIETTETFIPEDFEDDEKLKSVLLTGLLRILRVYWDVEDEPWVQHPGDEYIIGNIIRAVENPQYKWTEWYSPYATLSEEEYRAHGTQLVDILQDEYGEAAEGNGLVNVTPTQLSSPAGSITKEDLSDYSPGDGFYRNRPNAEF